MEEDSGLQQELELLEAIYMEDLTVEPSDSANGASCVRVQLYPATGDNVEEKYVCLTLEFNLTRDYPNEIPEMLIRNPRGLADDHVMKLSQSLHNMAAQRSGVPMLFELIELGKESLTEANVPQGQCVICIELLEPNAVFTKTECYHYFHVGCLLRYVEHCHRQMEQEREELRQHKHLTHEQKAILCPVCREPIAVNLAMLRAQAPVEEPEPANIVLRPEVRALQREMAALYARQQANGGIIDVEAERNKFLIPSESSCAEPPHPTPLHLFNQNQLLENINVVDASHGGKGSGQGLADQEHDGASPEESNKRETRNGYRKENRQRERRNQGREKSREEKSRPDSSGRQHERNFKKGSGRDHKLGGCDVESLCRMGGSLAESGPQGDKGKAKLCFNDSRYEEDCGVSNGSHHDHLRRPHRSEKKQISEQDELRHVIELHHQNMSLKEQNGHESSECQFSQLDMSNGRREAIMQPPQADTGHRRGRAVGREQRPPYDRCPGDQKVQIDQIVPHREDKWASGRGRGRGRGRGFRDSKQVKVGFEHSQNEVQFKVGRGRNHNYNDHHDDKQPGVDSEHHQSETCFQAERGRSRNYRDYHDGKQPEVDSELSQTEARFRGGRGSSRGCSRNYHDRYDGKQPEVGSEDNHHGTQFKADGGHTHSYNGHHDGKDTEVGTGRNQSEAHFKAGRGRGRGRGRSRNQNYNDYPVGKQLEIDSDHSQNDTRFKVGRGHSRNYNDHDDDKEPEVDSKLKQSEAHFQAGRSHNHNYNNRKYSIHHDGKQSESGAEHAQNETHFKADRSRNHNYNDHYSGKQTIDGTEHRQSEVHFKTGRSRNHNYHNYHDGKQPEVGSEQNQDKAHFEARRSADCGYSFDDSASWGQERRSETGELSQEPKAEQAYKYGRRAQSARYDRRKAVNQWSGPNDCDSGRNNDGHQGQLQAPPELSDCMPPPGFHHRPRPPPGFDVGS